MKIEKTEYTQADLESFYDELFDHERLALAVRLEKVSARLALIGPRIKAGRGDKEWSDHEVLAHIAGLSKFYGVIIHRISSGKTSQVDLLAGTNLRDASIDQMSDTDPSELLRMTLADHARTVQLLRTVDAASLRREANESGGGTVTAEFLARYPLINHLEQHVDQLERSLS
ncbi:MAG: hypothetical protein AUI42_11925 [Actinobacteria bacterium 13_1_40CM_2_65_8]|nr:MAG: hypothetical protein AUI42_11925 [Actinobacteria bacterium 13_1_40CM_2_65_8]